MNKKVLVASFLGTLIEVYDFTVFPFFIPILSEVFFSSYHRTNAINFTILAYVVSYFVKPFGSIVFGYWMDRWGRKKVLLFSSVLMTLATAAIGLLPPYLMGMYYGAGLIACRLVQGIAISGEFSTAIIIAVEEGKNSVLPGCMAFIGGSVGLLLGSLSALFILYGMPHDLIIYFGWRIPFLIGVGGCIVLLYIRNSLEFNLIKSNNESNGYRALFKRYKKELWFVFIVSGLSASAFYITFVFLPTLLSSLWQIQTHQHAILATSCSLVLYVLFLPVGAVLADRVGVNKQIQIAVLCYLLLSYGVFAVIPQLDYLRCAIVLACFAIIQALLNSALPAFIVRLFDVNQRGKALAISYNLSLALFGGVLPYLIATFNNHLNPGIPISICAALCLLTINFKEVKNGYLRSEPAY
ncbi:TPA: MFS transporter [Legionella pneumophila]